MLQKPGKLRYTLIRCLSLPDEINKEGIVLKKILVFFLTGLLAVTPCVTAYAAGYEETPDLAGAEAGSVTDGELSVSETAGSDTDEQVTAGDPAGGETEGAVSGEGSAAAAEGADAAAPENTDGTAAAKSAAAEGSYGLSEGESGEELFAGSWPVDPEDGGTYYIHCAGDQNAVWDIEGASLADHGNLQLFGINYSEAQLFTVKTLENGNLVFFNMRSGKVLDVEGGETGDGKNVSQFEWDGSETQQWQAAGNGDGSYVLWNAGRPDLVLDCSGGTFSAGTNLGLYEYNGTAAQSFVFQEARIKDLSGSIVLRPVNGTKMAVSAGEDSLLAIDNYTDDNAIHFELSLYWGGYYTIRNQTNEMVIEAADPNAAQGSDIILGEMNGSDAQLWKPVRNEDGSYSFLSKLRSNMVMETAGSYPYVGTTLRLAARDGQNNERFKISTIQITPTLYPGMTFSVSSLLNTDYVLDVSEGSSADGVNIDLFSANYTDAQKITLEAAEGVEGQFFRLRTGAGRYVAVSGGAAEPNANIVQDPRQDVPGQYWYPEANDDGSYTFRSALDQNYVLSTADNTGGSGTNIELYPFNGSAGQKWHLASMHITYCALTDDGSALVIRAEGHTPSSDNGQVYLFAVDPYSQNTAGYEPVASAQLGDRIAMSIPYGAEGSPDLSGKKFYLAVLDGGTYHVVSNGCTA